MSHQTQIEQFAARVSERTGQPMDDYASLWAWSVQDLDAFWAAVWEWCGVVGDVPDGHVIPAQVLADDSMPGAVWFPGTRLNYVDQVFRHGAGDRAGAPAVIGTDESGGHTELTWEELRRQTAALAATLRGAGVGPGDRVVGYLPNVPETVVAFLATASVGAIWAACGQDYAPAAATERLGQLEPTLLVAANGYRYGGKVHDRRQETAALRDALPTLRSTVLVDTVGTGDVPDTLAWAEATAPDAALAPVRVPFDHPLWVLFSSGTTGLPKGIVHGHGGVLLEHLKSMALHWDLGPGQRFCWYTSPSWMMWNYLVSGLLVGATIVTHDGSPTYPDADALWALAERERLDLLGVSAGYLMACTKAGLHPSATHDLSSLRMVGSTGSTLARSAHEWYLDSVSRTVPLVSASGGTDLVTAFVGGAPNVEVHVGAIACRSLGAAVEAWDPSGHALVDEVGELVITRPMPSMPVFFWNDPDGSRHREAYFSTYPGIWRHGDWVTIAADGQVVISGRSDSTLNRHGIRMGSNDIHQVVEQLPEVRESLVIGVEDSDGGYWMPLFVVLDDGVELDDALRQRINSSIREHASPRHVPDEIIVVPGVPHTRTGKRLEVPLKRIFQGAPVDEACQLSSVDDPDLVQFFADLAAERAAATRS